ncbi:uncharacterized protein METZ01_LOCUS222522, partial [marine metagenome]
SRAQDNFTGPEEDDRHWLRSRSFSGIYRPHCRQWANSL